MNEKQENLLRIKNSLLQGGGEKAIERQHAAGKHTARERLAMLFDEGSFTETGMFVRHRGTSFGMAEKEAAADGVITGRGMINGRLVYAASQDFTVLGGSLGEMHGLKITAMQEAALRTGTPFICINDSGGARIQEGVASLESYGRVFYNNALASGAIPQISVVMGPCAGGAAYSPALTDFVFMVDGTAQMFITGPQVIKSVTGEDIDSETLGGAAANNSVSGNAHFFAADEQSCIWQIQRLLSFLPGSYRDQPPAYACEDDVCRADEFLNNWIPESANKPYDMCAIIRSVADDEDFLEYQEHFAKNILCGFIRIGGKSVGVIANQPMMMAGCLDINASDKASRFVRTCDSFNVPLLTLIDVPGYLPGTQQEFGGIIRHGAKLLYAYSEAIVPKVTVITRKAYGGAYVSMCSKSLGADMVLAWPSAEIAVMGADGAANIIFSSEIKNSENPDQKRAEKIAEYNEAIVNPYIAASMGYVDDIIMPCETRRRVYEALSALEGKKTAPIPAKKHGNMPL